MMDSLVSDTVHVPDMHEAIYIMKIRVLTTKK